MNRGDCVFSLFSPPTRPTSLSASSTRFRFLKFPDAISRPFARARIEPREKAARVLLLEGLIDKSCVPSFFPYACGKRRWRSFLAYKAYKVDFGNERFCEHQACSQAFIDVIHFLSVLLERLPRVEIAVITYATTSTISSRWQREQKSPSPRHSTTRDVGHRRSFSRVRSI